ncbi:transposase [Singulisphaera acidiphila]|uniref:transposase n=1 Tax=Singulisphaera acidiphila TaxID=466153 RepID=UPI00037CA866|nr:transposase [Singulisphaera acidiphila]
MAVGSPFHRPWPKRPRTSLGPGRPGGGELTAQLLAIDLPELGRLDAKQIASLAGVAPHPVENGKSHGSAYIRGGRPRVRMKLYMSAFNARLPGRPKWRRCRTPNSRR